jgi:hypothetical protein
MLYMITVLGLARPAGNLIWLLPFLFLLLIVTIIVLIHVRRSQVKKELVQSPSRSPMLSMNEDLSEGARKCLADAAVFRLVDGTPNPCILQLIKEPVSRDLLFSIHRVETCDEEVVLDMRFVNEPTPNEKLLLIGEDMDGSSYYVCREDGSVYEASPSDPGEGTEPERTYNSVAEFLISLHRLHKYTS